MSRIEGEREIYIYIYIYVCSMRSAWRDLEAQVVVGCPKLSIESLDAPGPAVNNMKQDSQMA